jgi:hypothetical protein
MNNENPLLSHFRKPKLKIKLPSRGKWYPPNSLTLDETGSLKVYAMTAADDIKLRTGDASFTGTNIYEVISSCIPEILKPEFVSHIDLDVILLAIRGASYGDKFDFSVVVPNTSLIRKIPLSVNKLIRELNNRPEQWDDDIIIEDETNQRLQLKIEPLEIKDIFNVTREIQKQKQLLGKNIENVDALSITMKNLTSCAIDLVCQSIKSITLFNNKNELVLSLIADNPQNKKEITSIIAGMDVEYFNAIRDHINIQKKKFSFETQEIISLPEEIAAGAPEIWKAPLIFIGTNFLPERSDI